MSKCQALVCSLSRDSLHQECIKLVQELRDKGLSVDLLLESMDLEDIQDFCRRNYIPNIIILESSLFIRQQVIITLLVVFIWSVWCLCWLCKGQSSITWYYSGENGVWENSQYQWTSWIYTAEKCNWKKVRCLVFIYFYWCCYII